MTSTQAALVAVGACSAVAALPTRAAAQRGLKDDRAWRTPHVALAAAFTVALWIDRAQTREALRRGYYETNPILGPHPTAGQLSAYTALAEVAVLGTAAALPARVRPWVLGVALAVETFTIAGTVRRGIAVRFP